MEKDFHANGNKKRAGVAIIISDEIGFKTKTVRRDKEGHYIVVKGSIDQEDITLINIYAPNTGAPEYVKERLLDLKGGRDCNTLIVGDLNTPLSPLDRSPRQKIAKEIKDLNYTINQMDLRNIYKTFHLKTTKYTFF